MDTTGERPMRGIIRGEACLHVQGKPRDLLPFFPLLGVQIHRSHRFYGTGHRRMLWDGPRPHLHLSKLRLASFLPSIAARSTSSVLLGPRIRPLLTGEVLSNKR